MNWGMGLLGLWVILALGILASWVRPFPDLRQDQKSTLAAAGLASIAVQAVHFGEELVGGFYQEFPWTLGLDPWSVGPFAAFNVTWLAIWTITLPAALRGHRLAEWPLWFLAMALVANGIVHPVLAIRDGGYFPGVVTSLLAAPVGAVLLLRLVRVTR